MQRSTIAVLAVFSVLALLALFSYAVLPPRGGRPGEPGVLVPRDAVSRTSRIILSLAGEDFAIELEKKDGRWFLLLGESSRYPARDDRIAAFLAGLSAKRRIRNLGTTDGSTYGFAAEDGTVYLRLEGDDGATLARYEFGSASADGGLRHVRAGKGTTIVEAADTFSPWLDTAASAWIEPDIFRELLSGSDIQQVTIAGGMRTHTSIRGNDTDVEELSDFLESLRALDITNIPAVPERTVSLGMGTGETITAKTRPFLRWAVPARPMSSA